MAKSAYTCIVCPVSCRVAVEERGGELIVSGHTCKRGEEHARNEHTQPVRMLTTTVAIANGQTPRLPVISETEIPKQRLGECLALLYTLKLKAPVQCGSVIVENILDTGVNILASRSVPEE